MAQSEQFAAQATAAPESNASRRRLAPLIVLFVAAAFAANAWFFYHQGQRDGVNGGSETTSIPAPAMPSEEGAASTTATPSSANGTATSSDSGQPAATNDTAKAAATDIAAGGKSTAQPAAKAKSAHRLVSKANKPAAIWSANPYDRKATLLARPRADYPAQALRAHEEGTVVVLAQVDVTGHVSDVSVARHSGSSTLDRAAENEVRRWKFEPALHNGRPIMASVEVPVSYRLGE